MTEEHVVPIELLLATTAKVLASAVFVSGREPAEAFAHSAPSALHANQLPDVLRQHARWALDRPGRRVDIQLSMTPEVAAQLVAAHRAAYPGFETDWEGEERRLATLGNLKGSAQYVPDQGCLILPRDGDRSVVFEPIQLRRGPRSMSNWCGAHRPLPAVQQVIEAALGDKDAHHAALLVIRGGDIVGEGYAAGLSGDQPLESWSMGKSVMSTLIGQLVGSGALALDAPAPVPAWQAPGDPRAQITLRHLLNMSSGLRCTGQDDPRSSWRDGLPEHFLPYTQALDVEQFATNRPAEHPPATVGRYRNCDTLTLATIFHSTVRSLGSNPLTWPQATLFDRVGMHGLIQEPDRAGRFIASGFNYGTARDWARLGLLYLRGGLWQGDRVLPEEWTRFVRAPAPAWKQGQYGGQFWINSIGEFPLPPDTFYMAGGGGQYVFIAPSIDTVIVRMGHSCGWVNAKNKVNEALGALLPVLSLETA